MAKRFYSRWKQDKGKRQAKQQQVAKEVDDSMRWFGRTKPEQLQSLTTEIEKVEKQIALKYVNEMVELLELACVARDSVAFSHPDERALHNVQRRISDFLGKLDAETHRALMAATVKKKEAE